MNFFCELHECRNIIPKSQAYIIKYVRFFPGKLCSNQSYCQTRKVIISSSSSSSKYRTITLLTSLRTNIGTLKSVHLMMFVLFIIHSRAILKHMNAVCIPDDCKKTLLLSICNVLIVHIIKNDLAKRFQE